MAQLIATQLNMPHLASILVVAFRIALAGSDSLCAVPEALPGSQLLQVNRHGGSKNVNAAAEDADREQTQPKQEVVEAGQIQAKTGYNIHLSDDLAAPPGGVGLLHAGMPLQQVRRIDNTEGACLNFLHIPKNAGTTVELFTVNQDGEKANAGWGIADKGLKCSVGHRGPLGCQIKDDQGHVGNCSVWHIPPIFDPALEASYADCDTFCITRHPLTKAISQHIYSGGKCDGESFAQTVENMADVLTSDPFREDCHWVQQSDYHKNCQKVLRFERLEEDFAALMSEYKFPLSLGTLDGKQGTKHNTAKGGCDLSDHIDEIPLEAIEWVERFYAEDYKQFGYTRHPDSRK